MSLRKLQFAGAALAVTTLASCAPRPAPAPAPPPQQPQPPPPTPPPAPPADWRDAALSPGDWSYRGEGRASSAVYGTAGGAAFAISCQLDRRISLARVGAGGGDAIIVRTTFGERTLAAAPAQARQLALAASVAASDPLLDQIVFSRGRFLVQAAGVPALILPAWPEPARVIEDCRG